MHNKNIILPFFLNVTLKTSKPLIKQFTVLPETKSQ